MADKGTTVAGRFTVLENVQSGRIWSTLLATDTDGRKVLIRELRMAALDTWDIIQKLEKRTEQYRGLRDKSLPECIGFFPDDEGADAAFYLVFEYVDGTTVAEIVEAEGPRPNREVEEMLSDILSGLSLLHHCEPSVVHGGVRPSSIVKTSEGTYRLKELPLPDLPSVPTTSPAQTIVDEAYLPLEQKKGRSSPRSDLFGIGMTAVYMISGKHPHLLPTKRFKPVFRESGAESDIDRIVGLMIEPEVGDRPASAAEILGLLEAPSHKGPTPETVAPSAPVPATGGAEVEIQATGRGDRVLVKNPSASRAESMLAGFFLDLWVSKPWLIIIIIAALSAGPLLIPLLIFLWHPKSRSLINRAFARIRDVSVSLDQNRITVSDQIPQISYAELSGYRMREHISALGVQLEVILETNDGKERRFYLNGLSPADARKIKEIIAKRIDSTT